MHRFNFDIAISKPPVCRRHLLAVNSFSVIRFHLDYLLKRHFSGCIYMDDSDFEHDFMSWREWPVRLCENTHWFNLALSAVTYSCELLVRHWDWQKTGAADGLLLLFVVVFPAGFICGSTACAILCWDWKTGPLKLINSVHRVPGTHCRTFLISFKMTNAQKKTYSIFRVFLLFFFLPRWPVIGGFLCQFVLIECLVFTAVYETSNFFLLRPEYKYFGFYGR